MSKKIIISENHAKNIISSGIISEISDSSLKKEIEKDIINSKDLEKKVKKIVSNAVNILFKTLWQRSGFYENELEK